MMRDTENWVRGQRVLRVCLKVNCKRQRKSRQSHKHRFARECRDRRKVLGRGWDSRENTIATHRTFLRNFSRCRLGDNNGAGGRIYFILTPSQKNGLTQFRTENIHRSKHLQRNERPPLKQTSDSAQRLESRKYFSQRRHLGPCHFRLRSLQTSRGARNNFWINYQTQASGDLSLHVAWIFPTRSATQTRCRRLSLWDHFERTVERRVPLCQLLEWALSARSANARLRSFNCSLSHWRTQKPLETNSAVRRKW